jgi:hypothetical protein
MLRKIGSSKICRRSWCSPAVKITVAGVRRERPRTWSQFASMKSPSTRDDSASFSAM